MWRDPSNLNATALQTDEEQHLVSDQSAQSQYLHREKVGTHKDRQVRADEVGPGRTLMPLRRWNTMPLENVTYCLIGWPVAEVCHGAHYAVVAPIRVLLGHPDD